MLATCGSGLQELGVLWPGNGLTTVIQTDAVEFYYHSGVVSEILGTVRLVRCWLLSPPDRKISSVDSLSVVVSEMFKKRSDTCPNLSVSKQG